MYVDVSQNLLQAQCVGYCLENDAAGSWCALVRAQQVQAVPW
jgi:hypothetical protein